MTADLSEHDAAALLGLDQLPWILGAADAYRENRGQPRVYLPRRGMVVGGALTDEQRRQVLAEIDEAIAALRYMRREIAMRRACVCEVCGARFEGRPGARTHSDACRQRLHRNRAAGPDPAR